ncbi:MAG: FAD-dependent monooxygenase [Paraglaciecola sp.]|uniref:FAD-dependent monooxygenase n=1 Tax=Paraglaciecola sp. TaxID=1920173 RepID=UPI00273E0BEC|nr:FAD-dependent monooxygenase [Paraglaciecola sp.]MDP5030948.1 FAD-dependent monooxygenase [Paraglaciecola sp.]MDP5132645.1 FAD-dependent monooxygenase [Paraglaciecola sp.]
MIKNIAVVGAGIGGLSCALALVKQGFIVTVYEQASSLSEVGAGLQLSPNAMRVLHQLGVAESLSRYAFSPENAVMRHFNSGKRYFSVPLGKACLRQFGAEYWHVHRADLHKVLLNACQQLQISIKLGSVITTYVQQNDSDAVTLTLANGDVAAYDLVVGADGIHSNVQATLLANAGLDSQARFTGQVAWRGTVKTTDLPANLVEPNANLWVGPGKHFVSYYLRGGDLVNFVAVEERSKWQQESWTQEGDIATLRSLFSDWHPEVQEILAATQKTFVWALHDRDPLTTWTDKNVTLLGDACHPMLPFLAQGAAMAIEDAYMLAGLLKKYPNSELALQTYQAARLKRTRKIQLKARQNAALYHMSDGVSRVKLKVLAGLSAANISSVLAAKQLHTIYAYDVKAALDNE